MAKNKREKRVKSSLLENQVIGESAKKRELSKAKEALEVAKKLETQRIAKGWVWVKTGHNIRKLLKK